MSRTIALAGMMGVGKTTVAQRLGAALGRPVADTDAEVERAAGMPIPRIFAERGQEWFRAAEHHVVRELAKHQDLVVSLGGGVILSDANVTELLLTGVIVLLDAPAEVLVERLRDDAGDRPLLAGDLETRVRETLHARLPRYRAAADVVVDASRDPDTVTWDLLERLQELGDVLTPSEFEAVMR